MLKFVNAKINLGLYITGELPSGMHTLATAFYPIGIYNGTPEVPEPFCDIIEVTGVRDNAAGCDEDYLFKFSGRVVDCPPEKNLVVRAAQLFRDSLLSQEGYTAFTDSFPGYFITLEKHLPDGAGLGGGSADCGFTLRMLNELSGTPFSDDQLEEMALSLGADCPFFIRNRACTAEGVGEKMTPLPEVLGGWWAVVVKPALHISTREAFAGVECEPGHPDLQQLLRRPLEEWRGRLDNAFEGSLFPHYPHLADLKESLYASGAVYASMSGSGAALYGLYPTGEEARCAARRFCGEEYVTVCKL